MNLFNRDQKHNTEFKSSHQKIHKDLQMKRPLSRKSVLSIFWGIVFILLVQCSERNIYHVDIVSLNQALHKDSILGFTFFVEDTTKIFTIKTVLYYSDQYPYSNLYLKRQILYDSINEYSDTANYTLFDPLGKMTGKGFSSEKKIENIVGKGALRFKNIGYYTIYLQHLMRIDTLPGISKAGILITELK